MLPDYNTAEEYTFGVHLDSDTCKSMSVCSSRNQWICRRSHRKGGGSKDRAYVSWDVVSIVNMTFDGKGIFLENPILIYHAYRGEKIVLSFDTGHTR